MWKPCNADQRPPGAKKYERRARGRLLKLQHDTKDSRASFENGTLTKNTVEDEMCETPNVCHVFLSKTGVKTTKAGDEFACFFCCVNYLDVTQIF